MEELGSAERTQGPRRFEFLEKTKQRLGDEGALRVANVPESQWRDKLPIRNGGAKMTMVRTLTGSNLRKPGACGLH